MVAQKCAMEVPADLVATVLRPVLTAMVRSGFTGVVDADSAGHLGPVTADHQVGTTSRLGMLVPPDLPSRYHGDSPTAASSSSRRWGVSMVDTSDYRSGSPHSSGWCCGTRPRHARMSRMQAWRLCAVGSVSIVMGVCSRHRPTCRCDTAGTASPQAMRSGLVAWTRRVARRTKTAIPTHACERQKGPQHSAFRRSERRGGSRRSPIDHRDEVPAAPR